jgi:hypothetical protein
VDLRRHVEGKSADELLDYLAQSGAMPYSQVERIVRTAFEVRIAEMQRDTARAAGRWAMVQGIATLGASITTLVALLIAVL